MDVDRCLQCFLDSLCSGSFQGNPPGDIHGHVLLGGAGQHPEQLVQDGGQEVDHHVALHGVQALQGTDHNTDKLTWSWRINVENRASSLPGTQRADKSERVLRLVEHTSEQHVLISHAGTWQSVG